MPKETTYYIEGTEKTDKLTVVCASPEHKLRVLNAMRSDPWDNMQILRDLAYTIDMRGTNIHCLREAFDMQPIATPQQARLKYEAAAKEAKTREPRSSILPEGNGRAEANGKAHTPASWTGRS